MGYEKCLIFGGCGEPTLGLCWSSSSNPQEGLGEGICYISKS